MPSLWKQAWKNADGGAAKQINRSVGVGRRHTKATRPMQNMQLFGYKNALASGTAGEDELYPTAKKV